MTDGEAARKALIDILREEARPDVPQAEFEFAVDRVLTKLWIAGFVVTGREPDTGKPLKTGLAS